MFALRQWQERILEKSANNIMAAKANDHIQRTTHQGKEAQGPPPSRLFVCQIVHGSLFTLEVSQSSPKMLIRFTFNGLIQKRIHLSCSKGRKVDDGIVFDYFSCSRFCTCTHSWLVTSCHRPAQVGISDERIYEIYNSI